MLHPKSISEKIFIFGKIYIREYFLIWTNIFLRTFLDLDKLQTSIASIRPVITCTLSTTLITCRFPEPVLLAVAKPQKKPGTWTSVKGKNLDFFKACFLTICLGKNVDRKPSKLVLAAKEKEVKKVFPVGMFKGEPGTTLVTLTFPDEPHVGQAVAKVPEPGIMICRFVDL